MLVFCDFYGKFDLKLWYNFELELIILVVFDGCKEYFLGWVYGLKVSWVGLYIEGFLGCVIVWNYINICGLCRRG